MRNSRIGFGGGPVIIGLNEDEMKHLHEGGVVSFDLAGLGLPPQPMAVLHRATDEEIRKVVEENVQQTLHSMFGGYN